jgi:hypothetical protein
MDAEERAKQIAEAIQQARSGWPIGASFTVTLRGGCAACDPGACGECGHLFTGEVYTIEHLKRGQRVISDRTVHYLGHGITRYETGYVVRSEPVIVEIDVEELATYLDL